MARRKKQPPADNQSGPSKSKLAQVFQGQTLGRGGGGSKKSSKKKKKCLQAPFEYKW